MGEIPLDKALGLLRQLNSPRATNGASDAWCCKVKALETVTRPVVSCVAFTN